MKILQVSSFMPPHPGGLELVVDSLVRGMQKRSHDVRWIASAAPLPPGREANLIRVAAFKSLEELLHVPLPVWGFSGYRELYRGCKWADIVHVHDCLYPSSAAAMLMARHLRKPVVVTQHIARVPYAFPLDTLQDLAYRSLGRWVLESASRVVAVSAHVPGHFAALGVQKPIELIHLGCDARFHPDARQRRAELRAKYGVPPDRPTVLFVGRLVPKKGIADVIAVQNVLAKEGFVLVIAGSGALESSIVGCPNTWHLPAVPHEEIHELYALADVLFLPSRGEGLPLTLHEALLSGLPAVVSEDPSYVANVASAPGVHLREGIEAWAAAIREAVAKPTAAEEIAHWAEARFASRHFLDSYEVLYREVLQGS